MGLAGIAMAGIQPGRTSLIPSPSELPLPTTPCFEVGVFFDPENLDNITDNDKGFKTTTVRDCWEVCKLIKTCMGFVWAIPTSNEERYQYECILKKNAPGKNFPSTRKNQDNVISGLRDCLY